MHIPSFAQALVPLTAPYFFTAPGINDGNFKAAALNTHNTDRARHGVPALVWDDKIAQHAQREANKCEFKHFGGPYGENLYGSYNSGGIDYIKQTVAGIHDGWYNEVKKYDFNKPGFSMGTGHFTQVVWKNTKRVGCAWNQNPCKGLNMNFYKLVCNYDPPGNMMGGNHFRDNVPRPIRALDEVEVEVDAEEEFVNLEDEVVEVTESETSFVAQVEL